MVDCPEQGLYKSELPPDSRVLVSEASAECLVSGPMKLSGISFEVKEGQIIAVVGSWRAGKVRSRWVGE